MLMPLDLLLRLLSNLITIALLGGGAYIFYQWYEGELVSARWLYLSIGLLLWSFLGFLPILLLHRPGRDEPDTVGQLNNKVSNTASSFSAILLNNVFY